MQLLDLPQELIIHIVQQIPLGSRYPLRAVNQHLKATIENLPTVYHDFFKKVSTVPDLVLVPSKGTFSKINNHYFQLVTHKYKTGLFNPKTHQHMGFKLNSNNVDSIPRDELAKWAFQYGLNRAETMLHLAKLLNWKDITTELNNTSIVKC